MVFFFTWMRNQHQDFLHIHIAKFYLLKNVKYFKQFTCLEEPLNAKKLGICPDRHKGTIASIVVLFYYTSRKNIAVPPLLFLSTTRFGEIYVRFSPSDRAGRLPVNICKVTKLVEAWQPGCDKMERKWRGNGEEMEREWGNGERFTLYIFSFSLYFLPLYPFLYKKLSHLVKCGTFVANVTKKLTYALWENNSGSNLLRGSSASYAGLEADSRKESFF